MTGYCDVGNIVSGRSVESTIRRHTHIPVAKLERSRFHIVALVFLVKNELLSLLVQTGEVGVVCAVAVGGARLAIAEQRRLTVRVRLTGRGDPVLALAAALIPHPLR